MAALEVYGDADLAGMLRMRAGTVHPGTPAECARFRRPLYRVFPDRTEAYGQDPQASAWSEAWLKQYAVSSGATYLDY